MLSLDSLGKVYPNGVNALARFSAEIGRGEIVAIIGGSGCGKSTLLRAIAGLDRATTGMVTLDDIAIAAPHAKIGIIFQEPRLLPWLSVAGNTGFGLSDAPAAVRRDKVARALARVGLADKAGAWPRNCRAARRNASRSPARWCRSRRCCCWMSPSPRSMRSREGICRIICSTCGPTPGRLWCWLPTMSTKPWYWPIVSLSCGRGRAACSRKSPSTCRARATATRRCLTISSAAYSRRSIARSIAPCPTPSGNQPPAKSMWW